MTEAVDRLNVRTSLREKMAVPENTFLHLDGLDSSSSPDTSRSADGVVSKESAKKRTLGTI